MPDEEVLTFDRWLRRRRKGLDLTQEQLAERVSCSVDTIRKIEAGERRPSQQIAEFLARALEIAPDEHALFIHIARMPPNSEQEALLRSLASSLPLVPARQPAVPAPHRKTVALLFSTIQGSSALWEQHPRAMRSAYTRYTNILTANITAQNGSALTTADAIAYATFATVADALRAAVEAQCDLQAAAWDKISALPVCMAIHAGTVDDQEDDSYAHLLNRLAELCGIGHAGQILLSLPAQQLAIDDLPDQISLRDLGRHHLAHSTHLKQIFQVVATNLPADFPPLKTLDVPTTNLPPQLAPLIGRARERADIGVYLRRQDVRLLTLTGPGGIGKTSLGLCVAHDLIDDFRHGVYFVALAALADPALVLPSIAQTLGVKQSYEGTLIKDLTTYLCDKQLLLVLDNFEHLLEAARMLGDLLAAAPELKLLATSRARLNLHDEHIFAIRPLGLVDRAPEQHTISVEQAMRSDAVKLFVQRGQMVQPDFALDEKNAAPIAEICAALDGIPLAIELAAARIQLLPPQALRRRLHDRFALLIAGAADLPTRQQTLRNTLDWSYNLLAQAEQTLFMRLAVFAGGCAIDAIINVVVDLPAARDDAAILGAVESLLHQSLLYQINKDGEPWFSMLETIHAYALERLVESGDAERLQWRCAEYYLRYVESVEAQLSGPDQETYLAALTREQDNLRAVLGWALAGAPEETARLELALRLCGVLWRLWWMRGYLDEGRRWLARALATSGSAPAARAKALHGAGILARAQGDLAAATTLISESLSLWRALDHKLGIALALNSLGVIHFNQSDYEQALAFFEEGLQLYRELDDTRRVAISLNNLGNIAYKRDDLERAGALYEEALGLLKHDFTDQQTIALIKNNLGETARLRREYVEAARLLYESAAIFRKLNNIEGILLCLNNLVEIAIDQAQAELAVQLLGAANALYERIGAVRSPDQARDYQRQVAAVRSQIHDDMFAAAWSLGRSTSLDQLLTDAIEKIVAEALQKEEAHAAAEQQPGRPDNEPLRVRHYGKR